MFEENVKILKKRTLELFEEKMIEAYLMRCSKDFETVPRTDLILTKNPVLLIAAADVASQHLDLPYSHSFEYLSQTNVHKSMQQIYFPNTVGHVVLQVLISQNCSWKDFDRDCFAYSKDQQCYNFVSETIYPRCCCYY